MNLPNKLVRLLKGVIKRYHHRPIRSPEFNVSIEPLSATILPRIIQKDMRWLTVPFADDRCKERYHNKIAQIDRFWRQMELCLQTIDDEMSIEERRRIEEQLNNALASIEVGLTSEIFPTSSGCFGLCVLPKHDLRLSGICRTIAERAPNIQRLSIHDSIPVQDPYMLHQWFQTELGVDIADWIVQIDQTLSKSLGLMLFIPASDKRQLNNAEQTAASIVRHLIGSDDYYAWIDHVKVARQDTSTPLYDDSDPLIKLFNLRSELDLFIEWVQSPLPDHPRFQWSPDPDDVDEESECEWAEALIDFENDVYPITQKGTTAHFTSKQMSRIGEIICQVIIDENDTQSENVTLNATEMMDALNVSLEPRHLGCCLISSESIGRCVLTLSLMELEHSVIFIRKTLQAHDVPLKSWITFLDSELQGEWIGIYPDTPYPEIIEPGL